MQITCTGGRGQLHAVLHQTMNQVVPKCLKTVLLASVLMLH
jgi:hypothetical protein